MCVRSLFCLLNLTHKYFKKGDKRQIAIDNIVDELKIDYETKTITYPSSMKVSEDESFTKILKSENEFKSLKYLKKLLSSRTESR